MKIFLTGGAGFVGSHLSDALLKLGNEVVIYDDFRTGDESFISHNRNHANFHVITGDVLNYTDLKVAMKGSEFVWHFQANADVRGGIQNRKIDLEQNVSATYNVLEAMRENGILKIGFASSAVVYGEPDRFPTPEDYPLVQTSMYGASKLAAEALIQAFSSYFNMQGWIFRFVSFIGERYTHGVIFDFMKKLKQNPNHLEILGDGTQQKSYLYVLDGIEAMLLAVNKAQERINIFNLGHETMINVKTVADLICSEMGMPAVPYRFQGGKRGWIGDAPVVLLDTTRIRNLGWNPQTDMLTGIRRTVRYLQDHPFLLNKRPS